MKILIYGLNYAPEVTGTGTYTAATAVWLAARGHQVEVICGLPHYPDWKLVAEYADGRARVETRNGVPVMRAPHYVPSADALTAWARIRMETSFTISSTRYWLPRLFGRGKPDVVFAAMPPMQIAVWPLLFGWFRRVPWILHVQDLQVDAALRLGMLKVGKLGRLLYWVEGFLLRHATRVSTITESMRRRIIAKGTPQERTWMLPNWSDFAEIRPGPRDNAFRQSLGLPLDVLVVLYGGNMGEKQGLEVMLDAAQACRDDQRLFFVLAGGGGARPALEHKAAEMGLTNLRFVPVRPLKEYDEVLAAGDIHVVVQKRDAADLMMPSKLANTLAAGRACIATADPGTALHDVVGGHDIGLTVPSEDPQALTEAIKVLAGDAGKRAVYGQRARAYAERYLDKDGILAAFEENLEKLLSAKGSHG